MNTQPQSSTRPESPIDNLPQSTMQHIQISDPVFTMHHHPNQLYNEPLPSSALHMPAEYGSDLDGQKSPPMPQSAKVNGLPPQNSFRQSFTSFPNANRPRQGTASGPVNVYHRDSVSANVFPTSTSDVFPPHLTSPTQSHMQPYDRGSYDYGAGPILNGVNSAQKSSFNLDPYVNGAPVQPHHVGPKQYPHSAQGFSSGVHLSSQTPYGPHVPMTAGAHPNASGPAAASNGPQPNEDISTIFVVGFPEDMQEREFQNMFTFSSGFEAATLKIPNKELGAYGHAPFANNAPGSRQSGQNFLNNQYGGVNDPYNLVTVNQGGVLVDGGRDGIMASWPAPDDGPGPNFIGGINMAPRKQIIGFAKFRSREEALMARDVLQGRRVDIEKGAVLKAEMAKKNLHTKRGVGPLPGAGISSGGGSNQNLQAAGGLGGMGGGVQNSLMSGAGLGHPSEQYMEPLMASRNDLNALGPMAHPSSSRGHQWREQGPIDPLSLAGLRDEEERRRDREASIINAMGLPGSAARGPRDRYEEEDRLRQRREKDMLILRANNSAAFDAFHSVPHSNVPRANGIPIEMNSDGGDSTPQTAGVNRLDEPGPLSDDLPMRNGDIIDDPGRPLSETRRSTSPVIPSAASDSSRPYSPGREAEMRGFTNPFHQRHQPSQSSHSSESSNGGVGSFGGPGEATMIASESDILRAMNGLDLASEKERRHDNGNGTGNTSPQLPSPASGASSVSVRNMVDQNPPINTLYVGNLPTSPPPPGFPHDHLEESLRQLFQSRPGFRRLCFRQKSNGPMCFVEFEDVSFATRALNDLYGHTLNGLIKGGGIRLSYSKNPLGVRTPTSGGGMQQQQQFSSAMANFADTFQQRQFVDDTRPMRSMSVVGSPPNGMFGSHYSMTSPPPRFSASSIGGYAGPTSGSSSSSFLPRSSAAFDFGLPSSSSHSSFSPFGLSTPPHTSSIPSNSNSEHSHLDQHFMHSTPPINNLEAAKVG